MSDQFDVSKMTLQDLFGARQQHKIERSRRLANLPVAKKFEIVEKFRAILNDALKEDDERRATEELAADKD